MNRIFCLSVSQWLCSMQKFFFQLDRVDNSTQVCPLYLAIFICNHHDFIQEEWWSWTGSGSTHLFRLLEKFDRLHILAERPVPVLVLLPDHHHHHHHHGDDSLSPVVVRLVVRLHERVEGGKAVIMRRPPGLLHLYIIFIFYDMWLFPVNMIVVELWWEDIVHHSPWAHEQWQCRGQGGRGGGRLTPSPSPSKALAKRWVGSWGAVQWPEGNCYLLAVGGSCCLLGGAQDRNRYLKRANSLLAFTVSTQYSVEWTYLLK